MGLIWSFLSELVFWLFFGLVYNMLNSSLELQNSRVFPEVQNSIGVSPKSFKRCEGCLKLSCVCRELRISPKLKLRSRLSPNNFKRYVPDVEKFKNPVGLGCVIMPSISNKIYMPYIHSKKKLVADQSHNHLDISSFSTGKLKSQAPNIIFNSSYKKKFEKEKYMRDKIIRIGYQYLNEPEYRYQRRKLIELLYNLIQRGERGEYACSAKKKVEEIADFLVKHNNDLNFESFLLSKNENNSKVIARFDEFLKVFSTSIIK